MEWIGLFVKKQKTFQQVKELETKKSIGLDLIIQSSESHSYDHFYNIIEVNYNCLLYSLVLVLVVISNLK